MGDLLTGDDLAFNTPGIKFLEKPGEECESTDDFKCSTFKGWVFFLSCKEPTFIPKVSCLPDEWQVFWKNVWWG